MRKLILWATVASGVAAAYLMFKRGESIGNIASQAGSNPFGTLINEITRS